MKTPIRSASKPNSFEYLLQKWKAKRVGMAVDDGQASLQLAQELMSLSRKDEAEDQTEERRFKARH